MQTFSNPLVTIMWSTVLSAFAEEIWLLLQYHGQVWTGKAVSKSSYFTRLSVQLSNNTCWKVMLNMSAHQLTQYYQQQ